MNIRVTRQARPDEADAMLQDMATRARAGAEIRAALAQTFDADKLAAVIASLPPDAQQRLNRLRVEQPVRRSVKFIIRKPRTKKPRQ